MNDTEEEMGIMRCALVVGCMAFFLAAVPAAAQGPTGNAYGGQGSVASEVLGSASSSPAVTGGSSGPVTSAANAGSSGGVAPAAATLGTREADQTVAQATESAPSGPAPLSGDDLPFTGFDLLLASTGGLLLLGIGIAVRRLSHPTLRV